MIDGIMEGKSTEFLMKKDKKEAIKYENKKN